MKFRQRSGQIAAQTARMARADAWLYLAIVAYTLAGLALLNATGTAERAAYAIFVGRWALAFAVIFPLAAVFIQYAAVIHRFDRRRALALRRVFSVPRMAYLASGVALLMAMVLFQGTFTSIKNALPIWQDGFPHDRLQADIDAWLHLGTDPWRRLHGVGAHDLVRVVVEWNYNVLWFLLCFGALFLVVAWPGAEAVRTRYLVCFMLVWIVCGNIVAGLFLSAGPAFYGAVTGDAERFAEQLAFLAAGAGSPNSAVAYQGYLWSLHEAGKTGFGSGISAFPSVHVALVAMNALFLAEYSRRLGIAAFAYLAVIVASSVYLAWHYAIDGYASIAIVWAIHLAVKRLMAPQGGRAAAMAPARPARGGAVVTAS